MANFKSKAITIHNHQVDLAIVKHFGLASVLDIDTVKFEFKRYEVILEDGNRKVVSKMAIDNVIESLNSCEEEEVTSEENAVYTIHSIGKGFNGVYFVELADNLGNITRIIQRRISFIFQEGARVYIGQNRQLQLAD